MSFSLKTCSHPEMVEHLRRLLFSKPVNPEDAKRLEQLVRSRSLSRKDKVDAQDFVVKYQLKHTV